MQVYIILFIIVVVLVISLFAIMFYETKGPAEVLTEKAQSHSTLENIYNTMRNITQKLSIIKDGDRESVDIAFNGHWKIDENNGTIFFETKTKTTNVAPNIGWIKIMVGSQAELYERSDVYKDHFDIKFKIQIYNLTLKAGGNVEVLNPKIIKMDRKDEMLIVTFA